MNRGPSPVLIIDDDQDIRELLKILLEADGYRAVIASDGVEAWGLIEAEAPAVIVLDLMMPRMDGEKFLERLRASPHAKTPVIIMSGDESAQRKAQELNAEYCLTKPVEFDELSSTVQRFAGATRKRDVA
jgi:CheY-like chemotaxis protein